VEWRIKFKIATLTFNALETGLPYLAHEVVMSVCSHTRALRSSAFKLLQVPRTNLRFGSSSFRVSAPTHWNSLPHSVRFCESLATFRKQHLKTFFIFEQRSLTTPARIQLPISRSLVLSCTVSEIRRLIG